MLFINKLFNSIACLLSFTNLQLVIPGRTWILLYLGRTVYKRLWACLALYVYVLPWTTVISHFVTGFATVSSTPALLYCLGKQNNLHVSIFNSKYVWSTLSKHIRYDYFEIVEHSHIILVFFGERHYAIFRKKRNPVDEPPRTSNISSRGRGKGCASAGDTKKDTKKKKKLCADHRAGNHKVPVQRINVQRPWNLLGKSGMVLGTYQQKSMLKSMGEGNDAVARLLTIVS